MVEATAGPPVRPNLLLDQPLPKAPNLVWVSDITYLPLINGGWGYLTAWMDLFSRKVVGWQVSETMGDELVIFPLSRALQFKPLLTYNRLT